MKFEKTYLVAVETENNIPKWLRSEGAKEEAMVWRKFYTKTRQEAIDQAKKWLLNDPKSTIAEIRKVKRDPIMVLDRKVVISDITDTVEEDK